MIVAVALMYWVFPAHAGMSPALAWYGSELYRFPRTRGDEPWITSLKLLTKLFSPHTRG